MGSSKLKCIRCSIRGDKNNVFILRSDSVSLIAKLNAITTNETISAGMPICNTCRKKASKVKLDESKKYIMRTFDLLFFPLFDILFRLLSYKPTPNFYF